MPIENMLCDDVDGNNSDDSKCCTCQENVEWLWDNENKSQSVEILEDKLDVLFHRDYSTGSAFVRCTEPMVDNQYYWEIKMTGPVYGTDIMIGVGTSNPNFRHMEIKFESLLGMDNKSWGYSYHGFFQHGGQKRFYGQSFTQGDTIGVHLDLWKGTLTFYKDRKKLGIATNCGLRGKKLYAMAASTAKCSQMRMVYSNSFPSSLQFLCCSKLTELVPDDQNVLDVIENIPPGLKNYLSSKLSWLLDKRQIVNSSNNNRCCKIIDTGKNDVESEETYFLLRRLLRDI